MVTMDIPLVFSVVLHTLELEAESLKYLKITCLIMLGKLWNACAVASAWSLLQWCSMPDYRLATDLSIKIVRSRVYQNYPI
jgi:uncharacterized membrane protein YqjE